MSAYLQVLACAARKHHTEQQRGGGWWRVWSFDAHQIFTRAVEWEERTSRRDARKAAQFGSAAGANNAAEARFAATL